MPTPPVINRTMGTTEWAMLLTLSVLWGGSFFFAEVALVELRPFSIVLGRVGLAAVILIALVYATGRRLPARPRLWRDLLIMGALNNLLPFSLIFWGQIEIAGGLASILNATTPLFTVVLAHVATDDEKMTPNRLFGVLVGLAGVAVLIGPGLLGGLGEHVLAQLAVLGAAISYALAGLFGRRFRDQPPAVTAAGQLTMAAILVLPLALFLEQPWRLPQPAAATWAAIGGLALLSTAVAYILYFRLLATAGATNLLLVTFLIPVSAIVLGVLILGERLTGEHLAGMALIGLGLAAIDGRPLALLRPSRPS